MGINGKMEKSVRKKPSKGDTAIVLACAAIPITVLIVGLQPGHSYDYFTFLRVVVFFGAFVYSALCAGEENELFKALFLLLAVLYNPFIPIHLNREIWVVINVATIASFVGGLIIWLRGLKYRGR